MSKQQTREQEPEPKIPRSAILGNTILSKETFKWDEDTGELYHYKNGVYYTGERVIRRLTKEIASITGNQFNSTQSDETIKYIKANSAAKIEVNQNFLCLANSHLDLNTLSTITQTPKVFLTNKIKAKYQSTACYDGWNTFLLELVNKQTLVDTLQEYVGYSLAHHHKAKKFLYIYGPGCSGKSTFINIISDFFGKSNCSELDLIQLSDRFMTHNLRNKMINVRSDIDYAYSNKHTDLLKSLTGGDNITVDKKYAPEQIVFTNAAKIYLSGNGIPDVPGNTTDDDAFVNRWLPIEFPNTFDKAGDVESIWTTDSAKRIILNWAIDGYKRLKDNGWVFTYSPSINSIREWLVEGFEATDVELFLIDCCMPAVNNYVPKQALYEEYCEAMHTKNQPQLGIAQFHKQVKNNRYMQVTNFQPTVGGYQINTWKGIKFMARGVK